MMASSMHMPPLAPYAQLIMWFGMHRMLAQVVGSVEICVFEWGGLGEQWGPKLGTGKSQVWAPISPHSERTTRLYTHLWRANSTGYMLHTVWWAFDAPMGEVCALEPVNPCTACRD